ncbi:glycerophosphodiester phosphodiesterase [Marinimicrobium alkaliphilum]|uniref:glycerophosphodiester phosphodiesterase n=1 Tax=Marinimicrobium alkaliphilum TaxID=2202654 RepID=UPI000DB9BF6B|nr:glycerophosphodiester phosphodiesterase [Marinimicrobium alkaliphilum]
MDHPLLCIAHRGGPGPENSLQAVDRSLALGVDGIEIDVWQIEGELLATHDRRLGRDVPGYGLLVNHTLAELRELRLTNGEPIPTLRQILERVQDRVLLNIEIKGPGCAPVLARELTRYAQDTGLGLEHYIASSFDHHQLFDLKQRLPSVRRGVLVEGNPLDYAACCEPLGAYAFNTGMTFVNAELIADARRRGLKNWVYTVNHPEDWDWLQALGVDAVFTDLPEQLLEHNRLGFSPCMAF